MKSRPPNISQSTVPHPRPTIRSQSPVPSQLPILVGQINSILIYLLILISIYFIIAYLWIALHRIGYPFELEWMEGAMVDECRQLLGDLPLYRPPGLDYIPFIYPPGYFVVSALAMRIMGVGFFAPRIISLLSSLGSMLLLWGIVKHATGSFTAGIISSGLFAAAYSATGAWMDIARVDSLFIFWVILGIFTAVRWKSRTGSAVITALIFSAAFFTKQVALAPALALGVYYLINQRKQFILYLTTLIIAAGGGTIFLNYYYDGWYIYYVFLLSAHHSFQLSQIREFIFRDILRVFPVVFVLSIYGGIIAIKDSRSARSASSGLLFLLLGASLFMVSFVGRGNINSYINTLIPLALALALLSGWIWGKILPTPQIRISGDQGIRWSAHSLLPTPYSPFPIMLISLLIIVQFILFLYLPSKYIPTREDHRAGERLVAYIKKTGGPILLPFHGYLSQLGGKESSAHWTAVLDLLLTIDDNDDNPARLWINQFTTAMEEGRYEVLILDREDWFPELLKLQYKKGETLFGDKPVLYPVTGYPWRPQFIYHRNFPGKNF